MIDSQQGKVLLPYPNTNPVPTIAQIQHNVIAVNDGLSQLENDVSSLEDSVQSNLTTIYENFNTIATNIDGINSGIELISGLDTTAFNSLINAEILEDALALKVDVSAFDTLNNTVTNTSTGLVKKTTDLEASVETKVSQADFTTLNNTVTHASTGLVKKTTDLEESVGTKVSQADFATLNNTVTNTSTGLPSKASATDLTTTNTRVTTLETINSFLVGKTKNIFLENNRVNIICGVYRDVESNFGYIPETNTSYPMYFEIINNRSFKLHRIHSWTIIFTFNKDVIINSQTINNQLYTILSFVYNRTSEFKNIEMNIEYVGNNEAQNDLDAQMIIHSIQLIFDTKASQADFTATNTRVTTLETSVGTTDTAILQMILAANIVTNRTTLQSKIDSGDIIFKNGVFYFRTGGVYDAGYQCLSGGSGNSNPPVICSNTGVYGFGIVCNTGNFILKLFDANTFATVIYNKNIEGTHVSIKTNPKNGNRYVYLGIPYTYDLTMTWSSISVESGGFYDTTFNNILKVNLAAVFTQLNSTRDESEEELQAELESQITQDSNTEE